MKKQPKEMDMEEFFNANNSLYDNPYLNNYQKVGDRPEIINIQGLDPTGSLRVNSNPTGAELFILNGQGNEISFGPTPLTITDMDIGAYDYIVKMEGYDDYNGSIQISEGQICCVTVDLTKKEKTEQCQAIPPTSAFPPSQPGYVVVPERTVTVIGAALALIAGIIIGYFILKKKEVIIIR